MNTTPQQMDGTSLDISAENRARLKQLFPSVFTETINDKGELVESVDFEKLKSELGTFTDLFESRRERYGMDWPGKKEALKLIQTSSAATLKPCREESVNFDTTENLFIEGDNLEVLKLLQKSYYGKVKMIYIDPPYNTGKEFIYPDNYSESLETYLEYAGLIDGDGKKFSTNTANEGRFHTKWLNMMYPRLYLARNLLRDDGIIFISIDDNEVNNLRKMCDEIFGEENFVESFIWRSRLGKGATSEKTATLHEYILSYCKNINNLKIAGDIRTTSGEKKERIRQWGQGDRREDRPTMFYPVESKEFGMVSPIKPDGTEGRWRVRKEKFEEMQANDLVIFEKQNDGRIEAYRIIPEGTTTETAQDSILNSEIVKTTAHGSKEISNLFEFKIFDYPKPSSLIKHFISLVTTNSDIILDFFAGSATTGHAEFDLNEQDGESRNFILVQLPEPCAEDSEAFRAGYKTIADIGKERLRRVIKKLNDEQESKLDLENSTTQDRGFKVLKLDKSNFRQWQKIGPDSNLEKVIEQLDLHIDHIDHKATQEDLLYEILIKAGFTATEKIEIITMAGKQVFSIADGGLLICLEKELTKELIDAIAEAEPMQFRCLDSAFHGNDQLKANAVQTFTARNMGREKANQIVFKTI
jgi:adenine-specific DNA-methyltransferase